MYMLTIGDEVIGTAPTIELADAVAEWLATQTDDDVVVSQTLRTRG